MSEVIKDQESKKIQDMDDEEEMVVFREQSLCGMSMGKTTIQSKNER